MCAIEYYTYDDYLLWEGDWELISGIPLSIESPLIIHQSIKANIIYELFNSMQIDKNFFVLSGTDWKINSSTVVRPDVVLIYNETNDAYISKPPKIIVEVISKSTAKRDEKTKFELYQKEKVAYYVIVYPNDLRAKVYKLDGKEYEKVDDFTHEVMDFSDLECGAKIDFEKVFRRFRK